MPFQVRDPTLAMVKQDFKVSPLQKDGTVPVSELRSIFHRLDKWTDDELTELIADSKQESNGMVNINAFVDWLYGETDASKRKAPSLGVVRLDYDYPPAPGDIDHPGSYQYDVYYRVVPGLTFTMCQSGKMTAAVEKEFIEAIKYLDSLNVNGITGDCGFMMWFQALARQHTKKPVFLSSLAHLPSIIASLHEKELVAIFTANGKTLEPMRDLIKEECRVDTEDKRFVIVGCEDVPGFEAVAAGDKVNVQKVMPGMVAKAKEALKKNPNIRVVLMECTELPPYSDALRAELNLPVFDAITCADFYVRSCVDNPRFGLQGWQEKWDGKQEDYKFGSNLSDEDKRAIVNKEALKAKSEAKAKGLSAAQANAEAASSASVAAFGQAMKHCLGVLRIDIDKFAAPGDINNPCSFPYPVYYHAVKGLTIQMLESAKMTAEVEKAFIEAVEYLDRKRVSGITGDHGLMLAFQDTARRITKRPVFMSPLTQLPAIRATFSAGEKILVLCETKESLNALSKILEGQCGLEFSAERFILLPLKGVEGLFVVYEGKCHESRKVEAALIDEVSKVLQQHPEVRAIVNECVISTVFSDAVRCATNLPVYDMITCCDLFLNGCRDNPLFGLNGWASEEALVNSAALKERQRMCDLLINGKKLDKVIPAPSLGVIRLDYDYPPAPGDIDHKDSFSYDVYYRVVPGLTFEVCQSGKLTPEVEHRFIEAVKWLDAKGVSGITGDCGFMMWFQALARKHTSTPVFMSSLAHLPAITCAFNSHEKIAIFTANGKTLEPMHNLIKDECGVDTADNRYIIVSCKDVDGFEAVALSKKVDTVKVQPGIVKKCQETLKAHKDIKAILMECTELPPYTDALRHATGLPCFDAITNCDFFIRGKVDHPSFGMEDWQEKWDGVQDDYKFGDNLTPEERKQLVNKIAKDGKAGKVKPKEKPVNMGTVADKDKRQTPVLGIILGDQMVEAQAGDMAYADSFTYPVVYKVVPGLTYELCFTGKLPAQVKADFEKAIKYLTKDKKVCGISGQFGMMFAFQKFVREHTDVPVFMSALSQLPAIVHAYNVTEQIIILTWTAESLAPLQKTIEDECGVDPCNKRFVPIGVLDVPGMKELEKGKSVDVKKTLPHIIKKVSEALKINTKAKAIVLEVNYLTPFADAIRACTGLPVYDSITCCDLFMNGVMDNPLFGLNGWSRDWDGKQEVFKLGANTGVKKK